MATNSSTDCVKIKISAPGKVILHGEHSVVYGKLAIAGSLGLRTRIKLKEINNGDACTFDYKALGFTKSFDVTTLQKHLLDIELPVEEDIGESSVRTPKMIKHDQLVSTIEKFLLPSNDLSPRNRQALTAALYLLTAMLNGVTIKPFNLIISTDLTVGAGCGSSASYSVCLAAIFLTYTQMKSDSTENNVKEIFTFEEVGLISDWSFSAEKIIHGTPSGIDNTVCAYGSLLAFKKDAEKNILDIPNSINVLMINTKVQRSTKALVSNVRFLYERHPDIINSILDAMDKIAVSAVSCFKMLSGQCTNSVYDKLGDLAYINQNLLKALDVSHPLLDKICNILNQYGLRGKLTGAGGGGYAIAIIPISFDKIILRTIIKKLEEEDFDVRITDIGGPGVAID